MPKCCLDEHQGSRTPALPEELMLLPTGPSSPALLGDAAVRQSTASPSHQLLLIPRVVFPPTHSPVGQGSCG